MVAEQGKLSTRFGFIKDLIVESSFCATEDNAKYVLRQHVEKALDQRIYRSGLVSDRIQESRLKGHVMVDLEGERVGQVNGLDVYQMGDVSFGKPSRITARTYVGQQGVVNIEREARLSGNTHDKGVLILGGYLGANFAQEFPLSVAVSIVRRRRWRLRILHRVIRNPVQSFWLAD
jgi:predicted ATP-dependent protease